MDEWERKYVADYLYKRKYGSNRSVYFNPTGIRVLTYKPNNKGDLTCTMDDIYTWDNFHVTHFYYEKKDEKSVIIKYSFILNDLPFFDQTWDDMIKTLQTYTLDTPSKRNLLLNLLHMYLNDPKQNIRELKVADVIGFVPSNKNLPDGGWQLPDKYYFVSGNDFRQDIENNMRKLADYKIPKDIDVPALFKKMYEVTTIDYKDYIFAYGLVGPFLFALRSITKIMPLLALGGPGGKGKTAIEEYMTVKWWGNIDEIVGSAVMDTKPRVQGMLTGSTVPVCIDDCEDLKDFIIGILKRMTTFGDRVKKLKSDQTKKMDCEFCSPSMMSFNALPIIFDDPQFRQRVILLYIDNIIENEEWLEVYNSIPKRAIGRYIYDRTKDLTFKELVKIYKTMNNMDLKTNRQKAISRLLHLGGYFAKEWFDIDLDLSQIPKILRQTLMAGNEEIIELIQTQIQQSKGFELNEWGVFNNPHFKSWVTFPVIPHEYKGEKGYLYKTDNAIELAQRLGRKKRNLSLKTLALILETQWESIKYDSFYDPTVESKSSKGIFIPLMELDGTKYYLEKYDEIEAEINHDPAADQIDIDLSAFEDKEEEKVNMEELLNWNDGEEIDYS